MTVVFFSTALLMNSEALNFDAAIFASHTLPASSVVLNAKSLVRGILSFSGRAIWVYSSAVAVSGLSVNPSQLVGKNLMVPFHFIV